MVSGFGLFFEQRAPFDNVHLVDNLLCSLRIVKAWKAESKRNELLGGRGDRHGFFLPFNRSVCLNAVNEQQGSFTDGAVNAIGDAPLCALGGTVFSLRLANPLRIDPFPLNTAGA